MVDFVTFMVDNFQYEVNLGISLLIALVCFVLYNKTGNKGFISIFVGIIVSIGWTSFKLFVLGGVYFYPNLYDSGMAHSDIAVIISIDGFIGLVILSIETLTLLIGLLLIANELPKKSYGSIN
ncbi:MAG: hypothetical protein KAT16_06590 [Candidatus Heimdallarchaeota archaeon]|nr:hypothetical protein [Candidatus Heimdallarchaeota archaeon]